MHNLCRIGLLGAGLALFAGCSAVTSTTNTTADALHSISHGVSVSSRSSSDSTRSDPQSARAAQTRAYVDSQMGQIRREAAAGGGEHIDALAELMDNSNSDQLGVWMQTHYQSLFTQSRTPSQFIQAIRSRRS
ncbi:DUF3015 family protein [Salinisphaera sp. SPP-AMP-43]|uniref:DUF3015 family protein n=1 Tax=Salinisphaera sp. SPP-AMP-43 TaxID=3121288 RepID=UPI003C6E0FBD